jgi:hypothetical protein
MAPALRAAIDAQCIVHIPARILLLELMIARGDVAFAALWCRSWP